MSGRQAYRRGIGWSAAALLLLAGCNSQQAHLPDEDPSENGAILLVPRAAAEVETTLRALVKQWQLVVGRDALSKGEGSMDLSAAASSVTVTLEAVGEESTRVSIFAGSMVTSSDGQTLHAADPDRVMKLEMDLVHRFENLYDIQATGTGDGDTLWERMRKGK